MGTRLSLQHWSNGNFGEGRHTACGELGRPLWAASVIHRAALRILGFGHAVGGAARYRRNVSI